MAENTTTVAAKFMRPHPVFILGAHKSGTSLLRNLLDGHSKLFALPFESHFFQYYGYWVANNYRYSEPKNYSRDQLIKVFEDFIQANNDSDDKLGDAFVLGRFDVTRFAAKFEELRTDHTISEAFNLFVEASYASLFSKEMDDQILWVEKSVEHAEFAVEIRKAFPKAKFIHIIRNPYSNLVSLRKYKSVGFGYPLIHRVLQTLQNSYYHLEQNQRLLDNYLVIRYEDLVSDPTQWMGRIAEFVGIEFEESLLQPLHMGEPWKGNSTSGEKFSAVSNQRLNDWEQEISPMEKSYVNKLFPFILDKYGYNQLPSESGFWRPSKDEGLKRYLANRFYKFYLP